MTWRIPAKTFFLGEYAALYQGSALILTTTPCFELSLTKHDAKPFHPHSPAGLFWHDQTFKKPGLIFHDPYQGLGGMGASSAQFIGAYLAAQTHNRELTNEALWVTYRQYAQAEQGLLPSGYDVLAQTQQQCVYINNAQCLDTLAWPFPNLSFVLVRSGIKLATHEHLIQQTRALDTSALSDIVQNAYQAFLHQDENTIINCVNDYQQALVSQHLTLEASLKKLNIWQKKIKALAAKGCGALGADVWLFIVPRKDINHVLHTLRVEQLQILATEENIFQQFD